MRPFDGERGCMFNATREMASPARVSRFRYLELNPRSPLFVGTITLGLHVLLIKVDGTDPLLISALRVSSIVFSVWLALSLCMHLFKNGTSQVLEGFLHFLAIALRVRNAWYLFGVAYRTPAGIPRSKCICGSERSFDICCSSECSTKLRSWKPAGNPDRG